MHSNVEIKFSRIPPSIQEQASVPTIMYINSRTFGIRTNPDRTSKLSARKIISTFV